ncbi:MAG: ABC transporter permease subunit [Candidatus Latescibacteria bacterium]|nr:ABC transporter permease subunit [Candidatus Latescibacterota bacterium]
MLWNLIKKELRGHILEFRFGISAVLCVVLALVSVSVLRGDLAYKRENAQANRIAYKEQAEEYGSYRELERRGMRVDRPPEELQMLFYGLEKTPDRTAEISTGGMPQFKGNPNANPAVLLFPVADMLFIVGAVISLLAFFYSYDAISGERERGTLKLLLSYSVPRDQVILAKWIGGYVSLMLPFLIALLGAAVLILLWEGSAFTGSDWGAFGLSALIAMIFIAVMFSIGLFVSSRCARSSTAITTLLLIWVLFALVIPNASPYIADQIAPIPSISRVEGEVKETIRGLNAAFHQARSAYRRTHGEAMRSEEGRSTYWAFIQEEREKLRQEVMKEEERIVRDFERKLDRQIEVARNLSRLSPIASYTYTSTDIGGTGVEKEHHLKKSMKQYQSALREYVRAKIEEETARTGGGHPWRVRRDEDYDVSDLPIFNYVPEQLSKRVSMRMTDFLLLVAFAVLFFMAAFVSFLRADVT